MISIFYRRRLPSQITLNPTVVGFLWEYRSVRVTNVICDMGDPFTRISQRIDDLERRLTNCDSIYRMGTQIQATRNSQDRETVRAMIRKMREIDSKLNSLEHSMTQIPEMVREIVQREMLAIPAPKPKPKTQSQPSTPTRGPHSLQAHTPKPHPPKSETPAELPPLPKTPRPKRKSMSLSRSQAQQVNADVAEIEELLRKSQENTTLRDLNAEIARLTKVHKVDQTRSYTRMKHVGGLLEHTADP